MSREQDKEQHPAAIARRKKEAVLFYAGLVIAASGLVVVFWLKELYIGFAMALVGTGIVPFDKLNPFKK